MNEPQENSSRRKAPTTRSGGGSSVLISATCAAISRSQKLANVPVQVSGIDARGIVSGGGRTDPEASSQNATAAAIRIASPFLTRIKATVRRGLARSRDVILAARSKHVDHKRVFESSSAMFDAAAHNESVAGSSCRRSCLGSSPLHARERYRRSDREDGCGQCLTNLGPMRCSARNSLSL